MASSIIFLKYFLISSLFFVSLLKKSNCYEKREILESNNLQEIVKLDSLFPSTICKDSAKGLIFIFVVVLTIGPEAHNRPSSLKIVHKHGPCSKHNQDKQFVSPNITQIFLHDQSRVDSIQSKMYNSVMDNLRRNSAVNVPVQSGSIVNSGNYIVTVGLGTPKTDLSLIFDTGSGLTWTQCEPCVVFCHKQKDPIFAPSKSTSYANISCNTDLCSKLRPATGQQPICSGPTCQYGIRYGDNSFSVGFFAKERLTLGSTTETFDNFSFGCGQKNQGLFGESAGLLGLARDDLSFVSQTASKYGKLFTYCLPSSASKTGHLTFGKDGKSKKISTAIKFTPLILNPKLPSFYFLNTVAISVGGTKLPISPSVFSNSGTLIDSGTVITRLPPTAYTAMRTQFRKLMSKYPLGSGLSILDTCYDLSGYTSFSLPKVSFFFEGGVEVPLDKSGIIYVVSQSQVCLAFAGNSDDSDVSIFGNTQQLTYDIVYDVAGGKLGFGLGGCT